MKSQVRNVIVACAVSLFGCISSYATPVTVEEVGIGAHKTVTMTSSTLGTWTVYAGVLDLLVNGVPTEGFCIDPFHWSITGPQPYEEVALNSAPKPPGPMGADAATKVQQIWAQYYHAGISDSEAAALQIAIWEIVDAAISTATFSISGNDYGASAILAWVNNPANADAVTANVVGLTGPGQDYGIQRVPDSASTVALLGLAGAAFLLVRRKFSLV